MINPLTSGIEERLPWLDHIIALGARLDGDASGVMRINAPLASRLGSGEFETGM